VLAGVGTTVLSVLLVVVAIGPVVAMIWFAWWFLRAGKRYDERERAAGRRPPWAGSVGGEAADARPEDRASARPHHRMR
jgi:hypothetical protein